MKELKIDRHPTVYCPVREDFVLVAACNTCDAYKGEKDDKVQCIADEY